jgi:hypothetical protein
MLFELVADFAQQISPVARIHAAPGVKSFLRRLDGQIDVLRAALGRFARKLAAVGRIFNFDPPARNAFNFLPSYNQFFTVTFHFLSLFIIYKRHKINFSFDYNIHQICGNRLIRN